MALKEYKGNLLALFEQKEFDLIIHSMNCMNTMGAGIALGIANKYPQTKESDDATIRLDINKLGTYIPIETDDGLVINLYGQYIIGNQYGTPTSYLALQNALTNLAKEHKGKRIGTYRLGCNRGGADWNIVKQIIENTIAVDNDVSIVEL